MTNGPGSGERALIEIHDLVKTYDGLVVLDRFDLRVERGETCVLIGGSGAGKSTLGRLLVGLERPDSGEIWVDGVDIVKLGARDLDRVRRKFSVVFQGAALLDSMSVFDNVAFPMREEMHLSEREIRDRVRGSRPYVPWRPACARVYKCADESRAPPYGGERENLVQDLPAPGRRRQRRALTGGGPLALVVGDATDQASLDKAAAEAVVRESWLALVIVRPAVLDDHPATGNHRRFLTATRGATASRQPPLRLSRHPCSRRRRLRDCRRSAARPGTRSSA